MQMNKNAGNRTGQRTLMFLHILVMVVTGLLTTGTVHAQVPSTVSYQGKLTTPAGVPVADGTYSITFRIYDDLTAGNLFWEEVKSVTTKGGLFSVLLGQTNPLDQGTLSIPNLFLAISVGASAELTPRSKINVVPYATMVGTIEGAYGGMLIGDVYATGQVSGSSNTSSGGYFQSYKLTTADQHGVVGKYAATGPYNGSGVYGYSRPAENWGIGGEFEGGWTGVTGTSIATTNSIATYRGVSGIAYTNTPELAATLYGVSGTAHGALANMGVYASAYGTSSNFQSVYYGLYGTASGEGIAGNYGVYARATGGANNYGIYAQGSTYAGFFSGDVTVHNLSKFGGSFKIDHPLDPANKYLQHSFVESPDMMNIYNGNITLDADGAATVTMPDWFDALNRDFRYQLTAMGAPGPNLYVAQEINNNHFSIAGGAAGMKVSWQVTGVRKDVWAEAHRIQVEVPKDPSKVGTYLTPELFGKPETMNEVYEMTKRAEEMTKQAEQERERLAAQKGAEVPKK